ncbi:hypothetical protein KY342_05510 [Candidatus Woesearchaeota archaeon]|nr:hypothetical protein [Candidatus Woesearchaeota archaeon]
MEEKPSCCQTNNKKESKGLLSGLIYGLIPHTGCFAFIIFTILGVTTLTSFFKPLLLNAYFFYILIGLSFVFATISAMIYLRKHDLFHFHGIKRKWKYLSVLYGTTISINLLLFMIIFPITANMTIASPTGAITQGLEEITLKVKIPCPGHAPLISEELKTINGIQSIQFRFPNYFDVSYNKTTSQKEILSLDVFNTYPATITEGEIEEEPVPRGCSRCSGCSGSCGGTCSI